VIFDEPLITSSLAMGLIVFACAFGGALLGLRLRAKTSYDIQRSDLVQMSTNVILLDRVIAHYGPETR
jgi:hypothetical protein